MKVTCPACGRSLRWYRTCGGYIEWHYVAPSVPCSGGGHFLKPGGYMDKPRAVLAADGTVSLARPPGRAE